jgi:hypothetical protein
VPFFYFLILGSWIIISMPQILPLSPMLVFYVGNILDNKNTLCNGCIFNRFISFIQSLQVIWIVFVSSVVTGHKFLEDVYKDSMKFPNQNNGFPCNCQDGPLKASKRLAVSISFSIEDVQTSEQHCSNSRSSYSMFYQTSGRRGNKSERYPAF